MISPSLARRAVQAARIFERQQHWQQFTDADVLAFELPDAPLPIYATILGAAGQTFGISLYFGERALEQVRQITTGPRPEFLATMIVLSFDPPGSVPPGHRTVATLAGISERIIPVFFAVDPGMRSRDVRTAELRCLITVLDALQLAHTRGLLKPRRFQPHRPCKLLTLRVTGGGREIDVAARYEEVPGPEQANTTAIDLPWPMPELPVVDAHWLIGVEPAPMAIEGEERLAFMLIAADADNGAIVGMKAMFGDEVEEAAQHLAEICDVRQADVGGVPRRLTFTHKRLHDSLAEALTGFGVEVSLVDEHPVLTSIIAAFGQKVAPDDPEHIPTADDFEGWKRVNDRLLTRLEQHRDAAGMATQKPRERFFGDAAIASKLVDEEPRVGEPAFREWFTVCYRGKSSRRTLAERVLEETMPAAEKLMLQARVAARTGIYRVVRIQAPAVTVADILSDYEADLIDGGMATSVREGEMLPARVADAAGYRFLVPLGPKLLPMMSDEAIAWLEQGGKALDSTSLQQAPERLGQLWHWVLTRPPRQTRMTNTDSEAIAMQIATFQVGDATALRTALRERNDLEADETDRWTWVRRPGIGGTILADLELIDDQLLLTTNSDQRLANAKQWLLAVPGVTFVRSSPQDLARGSSADASQRLDPASLPPQALQQVQAHLHQRYMGWLDEVIPALGNKTPRQSIATAAGRAQVLRLIRSMPDLAGIPGVEVPRAQMRAELGLEAEAHG